MGLTKAYAGIGSRETPEGVCRQMTHIAGVLEAKGWILRSGGATGADSAFEEGVKNKSNMEIFLPSMFFQGKRALDLGYCLAPETPGFSRAMETVDKYHPSPRRLSENARILMARNAMQVLGPDLKSPSKVVIAWTEGGEVRGGTGQALRIAYDYNIPVINLGDRWGDHQAELQELLNN